MEVPWGEEGKNIILTLSRGVRVIWVCGLRGLVVREVLCEELVFAFEEGFVEVRFVVVVIVGVGRVGGGGCAWTGADGGAEADAAFADAVEDYLVEAVEGAGADEEDVIGADIVCFAFLAAGGALLAVSGRRRADCWSASLRGSSLAGYCREWEEEDRRCVLILLGSGVLCLL